MIDADPVPETLASRAASCFVAFRSGDERRMADLVAMLTPILWHTVRAQRVDKDAAEDVLQSVWLSFARSYEAIQDPQAVLQWLMVSARREAWRVVKRADRAIPTEFDDDEIVVDVKDLPEAQVLTDESDRRLWAHLTQLPERCQALLRVIAFADRPDYAAVADSLGMPVGSIGPTRGRCLAKLRALLLADPEWEI